MEYGDEMNDEEEKSYKKELLDKRRQERKERREVEAKIVVAPKVLPKRETRGRRMTALVGKAIEEDEAFWN